MQISGLFLKYTSKVAKKHDCLSNFNLKVTIMIY